MSETTWNATRDRILTAVTASLTSAKSINDGRAVLLKDPGVDQNAFMSLLASSRSNRNKLSDHYETPYDPEIHTSGYISQVNDLCTALEAQVDDMKELVVRLCSH